MIGRLPPKSFCLIRHGETTANRDGLIAGRLNVPLTEVGRAQAQSLSARHWPSRYQLFSSPLARAVETCTLGFPAQDFQIVADTHERDWGIFEGRPIAELPARAGRPEQGEDWAEMIDRVATALQDCGRRAGDKLPILICHSGVIRAARILAGQDTTGTRPPNATPIFFHWTGTGHQEAPRDISTPETLRNF